MTKGATNLKCALIDLILLFSLQTAHPKIHVPPLIGSAIDLAFYAFCQTTLIDRQVIM